MGTAMNDSEKNANPIDLARDAIFAPAGLGECDIERVLAGMMAHRIDAGDLYFQIGQKESWMLEDGIVKQGSHSIEQGVGVRAVSGEKTGFAYSDEIVLPALLSASESARAISKAGGQGRVAAWRKTGEASLYPPIDPIGSLDAAEKISLLNRLDSAARKADPRVKQVIANVSASYDVVCIAATDGTFAADVRPLVRVNVTVVVEQGEKREQASAGGGGRFGLAQFCVSDAVESFAHEAVRQAIVNLDAVAAPAGSMTVILGSGWPGVLLHEAIGHGLEGDFNRKGTSAFSGRVGDRVASELCTIVDDGTLAGRRGSLNVDDEGVPSQNTVLIENGVLKGYMQDKMNARLMHEQSTGNGRRESYAHLPMPRMTNTYMLAGESDPNEIIASVDKGLYAVNFGGGQVDITSGKFVFSASEAYLIENGKVTRPVKDATLVGNGPDVLTRVSMVGNDLALDTGVGVCGKEGQSVPVGVGQPTLRVDGLTVGGTAA